MVIFLLCFGIGIYIRYCARTACVNSSFRARVSGTKDAHRHIDTYKCRYYYCLAIVS